MGGRCSPFQANSTMNYHLDKVIANTEYPFVTAVCKELKKKMYRDYICIALKDGKDTIKIRGLISDILEEIGMMVTKYISNTSKILSTIPKDDLRPLMENDEPDTQEIKSANTKILGINQDQVKDLFHFFNLCDSA